MEELLVRMENLVSMRAGDEASPSRNTAPATAPDTYELGNFLFDYPNLRLVNRSEAGPNSVHSLSHREAELLLLFVKAQGQSVIERKTILMALWHDDGFFNSRNLDVYVRKLRAMLEPDPRVRIITLRGVGYRFLVE